MTVNYIGSIDNRHDVSEYILSTGTKLVLSKDEVKEFIFNPYVLEIIKDYEDDEEYDDIDNYNEPLEIKEPNMLDLNKAVELATEAHEGQYRTPIKVFPVNEHTLENWEISKLQQNNGTDFSICKEDGEYSMNTYLELFIAEPYITHPLAVMNMMTTEEEKIVAVLHDVFEKCPGYALGRVMDDSAHWIKIRSTMTDIQISERMFWMLSVLSKDKHISYENYIMHLIRSCIVANNKVPIKVKLADIIHNLSGSPSEHARQKYMKAIPLLLNSL